MANRYLREQVMAQDKGIVQIDGYAVLNTNHTVASCTAPLGTLSFISTGKYYFVLDDAYPEHKSVRATPELTTGLTNIAIVCLGANTTDSTVNGVPARTIIFQAHTNGSAANIPANCGFCFSIVLKNSTVGS